jgi:MerR family transcriptional regulator/heat shock protein HspR
MKKHRQTVYTISNVAGTYDIHPQTLRLYEKQGLLKPSRSQGNSRLCTDRDLERLELILKLTRDRGVNLAGVELILNMRAKMEKMQREVREFMQVIANELVERSSRLDSKLDNALARATPPKIIRFHRR